ncbi:MAG: hypothetical protein DMG07_15605 [Acidobacteria bacterium]|nr:MAG: hypothetical protein DMG07_15605 [Acidobacteriota bacterium]
MIGLLGLVLLGAAPVISYDAPQQVKRIRLTVENAGNVPRKGWPITQGVPFADGELERGAPVRVVERDGRILPTQSTYLATWKSDLKFVKWLLVDFQCDLSASEKRELFLEYGPGVQAATPPQSVTVTRGQGELLVDTGALRLKIRTDRADFLGGCAVKSGGEWREVFRGKPGPYLYLVGADGVVYDSQGGAPAPRLTVEDEGPLRVSLAVKGFHASPSGVGLCPYTLRIHAYAGRSELRLFHTYVFDQNADKLEFSEVGMNFPLDLGAAPRVAFGGQAKAHSAERWSRARILQSSDIAYEVAFDGKALASGEKSGGWASLSGPRASAFVALRDFWQQYPKGYDVTPDGIKVQFWPASSKQKLAYSTPWKERALYFNGYYGDPSATAHSRDEATVKKLLEMHPSKPLNLKSFDPGSVEDLLWIESMVDKYAPNRAATHNDTGTEDGTGAAKTHEVLLRFSGEPIRDEEARALGTAVQEPVIAPADPSYMDGTGATRGVFGGPDARFRELESLQDAIFEKVAIDPMHRGRRWGYWRFGYPVCSHAAGTSLAWIAHQATDPVKALRHAGPYNNEDDDPCWGLWTQFLRTGNRRFFIYASAYSRAMGDVGISHANASRPDVVGLMHYHSGHQWSGGYSPSHTLNTSFFLHYYLTGDRRMREIGREVADGAVRNQEPAGLISNRTRRLNREFTSPLVCLFEAYADGWDAKYEDLARRSLRWFLRTQEKPGLFPTSVFTRGPLGDEAVVEPVGYPVALSAITYPAFYEALRHFDDPLVRKTVLAAADYVIDTGELGDHRAMFCTLAYELTGDPIYAAYCKHRLEEYRASARETLEYKNIAFFSAIRNGEVPVLMGTVNRAMKKDPAGLIAAEKRLKERLGKTPRTLPPPGVVPPTRNLGVPRGYAN